LTFSGESYIKETQFLGYKQQQEGGKSEKIVYDFTFGSDFMCYDQLPGQGSIGKS
jgi:hypothetical protein